jgi:hypothetical protein
MRARAPQLLENIRDAAAFIAELTRGVALERYAVLIRRYDLLDHGLVLTTAEI